MADPTTDDVAAREFTPSMQRIRDEYVQMRAEHYGFSDLYAAEFDRALAQRDARIRAEALREAADEIESTAAGAWGGNQAWLTTGTHVGNLVTYALRERADRVERGESQ